MAGQLLQIEKADRPDRQLAIDFNKRREEEICDSADATVFKRNDQVGGYLRHQSGKTHG